VSIANLPVPVEDDAGYGDNRAKALQMPYSLSTAIGYSTPNSRLRVITLSRFRSNPNSDVWRVAHPPRPTSPWQQARGWLAVDVYVALPARPA
jgi:hypothetical protein